MIQSAVLFSPVLPVCLLFMPQQPPFPGRRGSQKKRIPMNPKGTLFSDGFLPAPHHRFARRYEFIEAWYLCFKLRVMSPAEAGRDDFAFSESDDMIAITNAAQRILTMRCRS